MIITRVEWIGAGLMGLVCLAALLRGGPLERRTALVVAAAWILSMLVDEDGNRGVHWRIFAIDLLLMGWLMVEAVVARRIWIMFAAAAQLFIVLTHVAFLMDPSLMQEGFFSAYYVWSYVVLGALLAGALTARRAGRGDGARRGGR